MAKSPKNSNFTPLVLFGIVVLITVFLLAADGAIPSFGNAIKTTDKAVFDCGKVANGVLVTGSGQVNFFVNGNVGAKTTATTTKSFTDSCTTNAKGVTTTLEYSCAPNPTPRGGKNFLLITTKNTPCPSGACADSTRCKKFPEGGRVCTSDDQCETSNCVGGTCAARRSQPVPEPQPTCTDGIKNADETGIDCGGLSCPACSTGTGGTGGTGTGGGTTQPPTNLANGEECQTNTGCQSGFCNNNGVCQAPIGHPAGTACSGPVDCSVSQVCAAQGICLNTCNGQAVPLSGYPPGSGPCCSNIDCNQNLAGAPGNHCVVQTGAPFGVCQP